MVGLLSRATLNSRTGGPGPHFRGLSAIVPAAPHASARSFAPHASARSSARFVSSARDFFGAPPLNYDTLRRRVARLRAMPQPPPELLAHYISANRRLQHITKLHRHLGRHDLNPLALPLHVSSTMLERELWAELRHHWPLCVASDLVVQTYVLTAGAADIAPAFTLVTENYARSDRSGILRAVAALVALLLRRHDYLGCFKLLALTVGAPDAVRARQKALARRAVAVGAGAAGAGLLCAALMPQAPVWGAALGAAAVVGAAVAVGGMFAPRRVGRVSWRPHLSAAHRWLHHAQLQMANKIVTHFEECHEVNSRNFHRSQVQRSDAATVDRDDFEVQLPQQLEVARADARDVRAEAMARDLRRALQAQRMVWHGLAEEHMFLDFWVSHGEGFEWVEPDQDPAEMVRAVVPASTRHQ